MSIGVAAGARSGKERRMNRDQLCRSAELLWGHWAAGTHLASLPESLRPADLAEGYAVQAAMAGAVGERVVGWKIAATSGAGQAHINVEGPIAGRLFASKLHSDGATLPLRGNRMRVAEAEFAFVMGQDLPPRQTPYSREEVLEAVAALHTAIELPDSRFSDFTAVGAAQLAADDACANLFVFGEAVRGDWREVDLREHPASVRINGETVTRGTGADVLGDPCLALAWIANSHPLRGEGLAVGQIITTGVCGRPVAVTEGDAVIADFGTLGQTRVRLAG